MSYHSYSRRQVLKGLAALTTAVAVGLGMSGCQGNESKKLRLTPEEAAIFSLNELGDIKVEREGLTWKCV